MYRSFMRPVPVLVLALAAGINPLGAFQPTLTKAQLAFLKLQEPARAAQAQSVLSQLATSHDLGPSAGFTPRGVLTNTQGRTVVRFRQTHEGLRVWGGEAIAHVEADGKVKVVTQGLKLQVSLAAPSPRLSAEQAKTIALQDLSPKGTMTAAPKVEQVVFPTRFTGGLASRFDTAKQHEVWDREMSVWAKPSEDPYVQAYEVRTLLANRQDGHKEMSYIIDANTGSILRKWNAIQGDAPAQGTGISFYRGSVPLTTSQSPDLSYSLVAQDRGTQPQPYFLQAGITQMGLTTCYGAVDMVFGNIGFNVYSGMNASNQWGDGTLMPFPYDFTNQMMLLDYSSDGTTAWEQGALAPAGETTAVDCHYGLSMTWDFYKSVLGRDGIDNAGTSTFGIVHYIDANWFGAYPYYDNAYWAPWYFGMVFGDGSDGTPWSAGGYGMKALTEIDITGHELSHGVNKDSAALIYAGQSGGLNEGNSDVFGKMVQAYADGGGTGTTVPDFPAGDLTKWEVGYHSMPQDSRGDVALRYMYHPSLDGVSADGWYDGIDLIDVHFSSGPLNRFFYFSAGASSDPSSTTYSPYYPAGMNGIGNDKAARIWYKTLTEYLVSDADYDAARTASITSADELYGPGSPEELAVMKAWSAVNVGLAPGQSPRPRVTFPVINPAGSWLDLNAQPSGILQKVQIFPTRTNVRIQANVTNTTNTAVTFSTPTWTMGPPGTAGVIMRDGTWTTPNWNYYEDLLSVQATSQADPSQFARSRTLLVDLDADTDTDIDAIDLGATAMSWYKPGAYFDTPNPNARIAGGGDWDLVFFTQAFSNAFKVK